MHLDDPRTPPMQPEFRALLLERQPDLEGRTLKVEPHRSPPMLTDDAENVDLAEALNELGDDLAEDTG
jgi:hypothetical protein